jgi:hypothetical protein
MRAKTSPAMPTLKAVKPLPVWLPALLSSVIWLFAATAQAHTMPLALQVRLQTTGQQLQLLLDASTPTGVRVQGARFEYLLTGLEPKTAQARAAGLFDENPPASYQTDLTALPAGRYRFVLRDRTFEREVVEASTELRWPPRQSWQLQLPAFAGGGPNTTIVLAFLGLPVVLGLLVLAWALWRKPSDEAEAPNEAASS